jgi:hypothetical protein
LASDNALQVQVDPTAKLSKFKGKDPMGRGFLASEDIDLRPLLKLKEKKIGKVLRDFQKHFGIKKIIAPEMMLGLEIKVNQDLKDSVQDLLLTTIY